MSFVLGVDIGGTNTRGRLVRDGETIAVASAESASLTAAGHVRAEAALNKLIGELHLEELGPLDAICVGTAGSGSIEAREFLANIFSRAVSSRDRVKVVNDAFLILPAAGCDEGIALIGGTGSKALGSTQGRQVEVGGWGYLLGDEGSGFWIVRSAIRELCDRNDRAADLGEIGELLLGGTGTRDVAELMQRFHDRPEPDGWARYASDVLKANDPSASIILSRAAEHLSTLAETAATRLAGRPDLPVIFAGGLLTGFAQLLDAVRTRISTALPGAAVIVETEPPIVGAIRLAEELARSF